MAPAAVVTAPAAAAPAAAAADDKSESDSEKEDEDFNENGDGGDNSDSDSSKSGEESDSSSSEDEAILLGVDKKNIIGGGDNAALGAKRVTRNMQRAVAQVASQPAPKRRKENDGDESDEATLDF